MKASAANTAPLSMQESENRSGRDGAACLRLPGAPAFPQTVVERDVPIVMRDGVRLHADIHRPADADGRPVERAFPVVIVQTPYNKWVQRDALDCILNKNFIRHGYVQVVVDVRGTGGSFGVWETWGEEEQRDYLETAQWVLAQPFCNGKLGFYGPSYLGIAALLAAGKRPKGLGAVFTIATAEDIYRDLYRGGDVPYLICVGLFVLIKLLGLLPPRYILRHPLRALRLFACRIAGLRWPIKAALSLLRDGELAYDGPFFRARSPGNCADRIDVPTFLVSGWFDIYQRGTPRLYEKLRLPPGRKQLLMGPWYHVSIGRGLGEGTAPPGIQTLALLWFDRWLKEADNGIGRFGPVTSYRLGSDRWVRYADFPQAGFSRRKFYLGPAGKLEPNPPVAEGSDRRRAKLLGGWRGRSSTQWSAGALRTGSGEFDNRFVESGGLTYTTEPLREALHISGPMVLIVKCATSGDDANWIVTISDVAPDGRSTHLTGGALLQSMRAVESGRSKYAPSGDMTVPFHPFTRESRLRVSPGEPVWMNIEIFNTDAVIARGHRLRLTLASSDLPTLGPTPSRARGRAGTIRVHYGPNELSRLVIPHATENVSRTEDQTPYTGDNPMEDIR